MLGFRKVNALWGPIYMELKCGSPSNKSLGFFYLPKEMSNYCQAETLLHATLLCIPLNNFAGAEVKVCPFSAQCLKVNLFLLFRGQHQVILLVHWHISTLVVRWVSSPCFGIAVGNLK